jgi:outer membrane protein TolC
VRLAGAYPNTNLALGYQYMFSGENMKAFDRGTFIAGTDPAMNLSLPAKVAQAAQVALEEAKAKGKRFEAAKFALQQKVLTQYYDMALTAERLRIQQETADLLKMVVDVSAQQVRGGAAQVDVLKAQTEYAMAQDELANMKVELASMRAMLNGMLARSPDAPLEPPAQLPAPRPLPLDDAQLLQAAMQRNPELAELAFQAQARQQAIELARMAWWPDFFVQVSIQGSIQQALMAMVMLPVNAPAIQAGIDEADAMHQAALAMLRQGGFDRAGQFVATLQAVHNHERQAALYRDDIIPRSRQAFDNSLQAYTGGVIGFADVIDSLRVLLGARQSLAQARMNREKRLAELETLLGADLEALKTPATTSQATSQP